MVLTKALDHLMSWHARCTSGECAFLPFSALLVAPLLRARSCEYIVRNSTLKVRERPEVQGAGCRGGAGVHIELSTAGKNELHAAHKRKGVCPFPTKA